MQTIFHYDFSYYWASLIAQLVKNPPVMQETLVRIPGSGRSTGEGIGYQLQYSWASLVAQLVKKPALQCGRPGFHPWVGKIPWRRERLPTPIFRPGEFHGLYSSWNSPGQNTGVGSLSLLQGIFPTQGSNPGLHTAGRFFTS